MNPDYIQIAQGMRALEARRAVIRQRKIIILMVFLACTLFFAWIG